MSALLDQIGQGQQTLDAANNGLTSLTSLLEQALSTVQQAQQTTPTAAAATTGTVALTSLNAGGNLLVNVGATTYTVAITASEALSSIESQINAVSRLGSNGAVTASDDGGGPLGVDRQYQHHGVHCRCECGVSGARRHHQRHGQQRRRTGFGHAHCKATTTRC